MTALASQKSQLAKLMATENITVEHRNVPTASFNVKDRVLTLPIFEDEMSVDLYDLMVSHEVGHALETPAEGWHDNCSEYGPVFQSYLNVVEDARIEKIIKRKFPGILPAYRKGYKELLDRDFFGLKRSGLDGLNLIDRLNLHFKTGTLLPFIAFDEEEAKWVKRIAKVETFEEALELTKELFSGEKEKAEQQAAAEAEEFEMSDDDTDMNFDSSGFGDSDEESEEDGDEGDNSSNSSSDEDGEDGQSSTFGDDEGDEAEFGDDDLDYEYPSAGRTAEEIMESSTERSFRNNVGSLSKDDNTEYKYFTMKSNYTKINKEILKGYKHFFKIIEESNFVKYTSFGQQLFSEWSANNKNVINHMIKEFELKKRAGEFKRAKTAKSGELNMEKVFSYKFNDDIFKRVTVVPKGKNHGFVMLLDWSGSMHSNLAATIDQLMNFVIFCRKTRIPFEVYIFTNEVRKSRNEEGRRINPEYVFEEDTIVPENETTVLQLFSSAMSVSEFNKACVYMTMMRKVYSRSRFKYSEATEDDWKIYDMTSSYPSELRLSGTPLDSSLIIMDEVVNEFKSKYKIEICNFIVLTDGDSSTAGVIHEYNRDDYTTKYVHDLPYIRGYTRTKMFIRDDVTRKTYSVKQTWTKTLLEIIKDRTNCNLIGFYVIDNKPRSIVNAAAYYGIYDNNIVSKTREKNFIEVNGAGYDSYFLIPGGKSLVTDETGLDVEAGVSKSKLKTAFMKNNKRKVTSRVFVNRVIELVA